MSLRYLYPEMAAATADFCTWGWGVRRKTPRAHSTARQETAATRDFDPTYDRSGSKSVFARCLRFFRFPLNSDHIGHRVRSVQGQTATLANYSITSSAGPEACRGPV